MTLSPEERAQFIELVGTRSDTDRSSNAVRFFSKRSELCLNELGAVPGFDRVRACMLRLLPRVVEDPVRRQALVVAADLALQPLREDGADAADALRRHPAWVGVCALLIAAELDRGDGLDDAVLVASAGFAELGSVEAKGRGEVLWAIAEAADEAGWHDVVGPTLNAAMGASFYDPHNFGRVSLVRVLHLIETRAEGVDAAVEQLIAAEDIDDQTRSHALWIGAHRDRNGGRMDRAVHRLEDALRWVDADTDPDVVVRIEDTMKAWGIRSDAPAEA